MSNAISPQGSLALLTDLYQLTMANGYWASGMKDHEASFYLHFRRAPFEGSYAVACGLGPLIDFLREFRFSGEDLRYLSTLQGRGGAPLFDPSFLRYLENMEFACSIHAMPEGTVVFPYEPLLRVEGPLIQAQLLETACLNLLNFPTLVATKASRICQAAQGEPVMEFGLRRAQGINGGLAASRAAYIGGCVGTSHVLAGKQYDIPVMGTHAHSWVMAFDNEEEAFRAYAKAMPHNAIFLVDTYDTLEGVRNAIKAGIYLRDELGSDMAGIRLDSGDLTALSIQAREMLDAAGFPNAAIVGSNDLDEYKIEEMKKEGAKVNIWGVGTRLVTAYDDPALGGVYKLSAIRAPGEEWKHRFKVSEDKAKSTDPGVLQVRRFFQNGVPVGDMLYDDDGRGPGKQMVFRTGESYEISGAESHDLLQPIFDKGKLIYLPRSIHQKREYALRQVASLPASLRRLKQAETYPVGLEQGLWELKAALAAGL